MYNRGLVLFTLVFAGLAGLMYLSMLNSGWGYDSMLYLVIGDDWRRGILPFTNHVEVKPVGMFLLDRIILSVSRSPYWVNAVVLAIDLTFVAVVVQCFSQWLTRTERMVLAVSLLSLGFLTEMGYLLTDQPMTIFAVLGFRMLFPSAFEKQPLVKGKLLGGVAFGLAFLFKAAAGFYVVAGCVAMAVKPNRKWSGLRHTVVPWVRDCFLIGIGVATPFALAAIWAQQHGILQRMMFLTIWVPLFRFPSHPDFLWPFLGKLGPFLALWLAAVIYWFVSPGFLDPERRTWQRWLLIFSIFSSGQLLKNQGSHYLIASLPFMTAFIVSVGSPVIQRIPHRFAPVITACVLAAACLFVFAFRAKILIKVHAPDFRVERRLAETLVSLTRPGEQALFINGVTKSSVYAYWLTGLRPPRPWQYLAIDVYSYGLADTHQGQLVESLRNSNTALVGFIPDQPPSYLNWPWPFSQDELDEAQRILHERFEPVDSIDGIFFPGLWKIKGRTADSHVPIPSGPYATN